MGRRSSLLLEKNEDEDEEVGEVCDDIDGLEEGEDEGEPQPRYDRQPPEEDEEGEAGSNDEELLE